MGMSVSRTGTGGRVPKKKRESRTVKKGSIAWGGGGASSVCMKGSLGQQPPGEDKCRAPAVADLS
jgi:hypothetical protein